MFLPSTPGSPDLDKVRQQAAEAFLAKFDGDGAKAREDLEEGAVALEELVAVLEGDREPDADWFTPQRARGLQSVLAMGAQVEFKVDPVVLAQTLAVEARVVRDLIPVEA
jgi:hypothetical protein